VRYYVMGAAGEEGAPAISGGRQTIFRRRGGASFYLQPEGVLARSAHLAPPRRRAMRAIHARRWHPRHVLPAPGTRDLLSGRAKS